MKSGGSEQLLERLIVLCKDISAGRFKRAENLFELTKQGKYPHPISDLAESFGMMMVKVEAREYRLEQMIEELKKAHAEISSAKDRLSRENIRLRQTLKDSLGNIRILGVSRVMTDLCKTVERIADTPVNVLVTGETGTGKELVAKTIHYKSSRSEKPFVALNCSAIPESIFESEIFGIEKGVATGVEARIGKMEQAQGGTLFLDEVGDMPLLSQGKILRVIEDRTLERVGGRKNIPVDVRIVAATNRDLKKEIKQGRFREDLYYRLNTINLHLPPLRERKEDVELLVNYFLEQSSRRMGRSAIRFTQEAIALMKEYPWFGNVRELANEIERAVALAWTDRIGVDQLSEALLQFRAGRNRQPAVSVRGAEKSLIEEALKSTGGNKSEAARVLGVSREGLRKKMMRFGL